MTIGEGNDDDELSEAEKRAISIINNNLTFDIKNTFFNLNIISACISLINSTVVQYYNTCKFLSKEALSKRITKTTIKVTSHNKLILAFYGAF